MVITALVLALAPVSAQARLAPPLEQPPDTEELEAEPPDTEDELEQPELEQPEPVVEAPPEEGPPEGPEPESVADFVPLAFRDPTPEERARGLKLRYAGLWTMAAGGVVAVTGFGLTLAYTIVGDRREAVADPVLREVERAATIAQAGGVLLASGIAIATVGGIIYNRSQRELQPRPVASLRVTPAVGGLVVSGRF